MMPHDGDSSVVTPAAEHCTVDDNPSRLGVVFVAHLSPYEL
jgi:hypothetical protein